jgi:hypothetical protein
MARGGPRGQVSKRGGGRTNRGSGGLSRGARGGRGRGRPRAAPAHAPSSPAHFAPPEPAPAPDSEPDLAAAALDSLRAALAAQLDSFERSATPDDPRSLLVSLRAALSSRPVSQCIDDFPRAPKLLVHASHDSRVLLHAPSTDALCTCLLLYARVDTSKTPRPASARAKTWAATVLADLVTGARGRAARPTGIPGVPACPRPILDHARIIQLTTVLTRRLDRHSGCAQTVYDVCVELAPLVPLMLNQDILPVVQAAILAAARLPVPLNCDLPAALNPIPEVLSCLFLPSPSAPSSPTIMQNLSVEAQAAVLRLCPAVLDDYLTRVYSAPTPNLLMQSRADELAAFDALALAAAHDVNIHWRLIDEAQRAMSTDSEPFSMRTWAPRWFLRAAHAATVDRIRSARNAPAIDSAAFIDVASLHRRFAPHLRRLVSTLEAFGSPGVDASAASILAVRDALAELCAVTNGEDSSENIILLPLDAHAALMAMESQVQIIIACAARAIAEQTDSCCSAVGRKAAIGALSQVMVALDCVRLAGMPVESAGDVTARVSRVSLALHLLLVGGGAGQWKNINELVPDSLVAAVAVGAGQGGASIGCVRMRHDSAWLGELLRMCETGGNKAGLSDLFEQAIEEGVRITRLTANSEEEGVSGGTSLCRRRIAWDDDLSINR